MPKLKRMSGQQVIAVLGDFGFSPVSQAGSHIKLLRVTEFGHRQTLTVPNHKEIDTGTLKAIIRLASQFIKLDDLAPHFYG